MNPQMLEKLASQHRAELRDQAAGKHELGHGEAPQSLRVRTGWTLIHLGLRLAVQPTQRQVVNPRPARS